MHKHKLCIITRRGSLLSGVQFEDGPSDTVIILATGLHGNCYTNPFIKDMGNRVVTEGIHFLYAETCDAFPRMESYNIKTGKEELLGSCTERFTDSIDDIGSYVDKAEQMGYRHIYLGGHCFGASKVIHYLAVTRDPRVERFLVFSPGDLGHQLSKVTEDEKKIIFEMMKKGRGEDDLPFTIMGWLNCKAATAYDFVSSQNVLYNFSAEGDPPCNDLQKISHRGAIIIGECDCHARFGAGQYIEKINNQMPGKDDNVLIVIDGANHTFDEKGKAVAEAVLPIIYKWRRREETVN